MDNAWRCDCGLPNTASINVCLCGKNRPFILLDAEKYEYDLDNREDKAMYDDMLDECTECCTFCTRYGAARILEEIDPTAYRCGFNDYVDGLDDRYKCPICGDIFDDDDAAKYHCQTEPEETE
jgi:rubrerythrin